jgi:hypothetical protein
VAGEHNCAEQRVELTADFGPAATVGEPTAAIQTVEHASGIAFACHSDRHCDRDAREGQMDQEQNIACRR